MSILSLISSDGFIVVNRKLLEMFGIYPALLLGELANEANYWMIQGKLEDGFFYSTAENIKKRTGLTHYQQVQAIKKLEQTGILRVVVRGIPATKYFKLDEKMLFKALSNTDFKKL